MCGHYPDNFCWYVEGVLTLVAALIGYLGNIYSLKVFSRQKDHKTFHHLLLLLAIFDTVSYLRYDLNTQTNANTQTAKYSKVGIFYTLD